MRVKKHILIIFAITFVSSFYAQTKSKTILPDSIYICKGDSFLIKFSSDIASEKASIQWFTDYSIIYNTKQLYVKNKGRYIIKIFDDKKTLIDTTYVKIIDKPRLNLRDTFLCLGSNLIIEKKINAQSFLWSTDETSSKIIINKPGKYWLRATTKDCSVSDTFNVKVINAVTPNFGKEHLVCENESNKQLSVKTTPDAKLYWNNGSNATSIPITKEGIYWLKSITKNCGTKTDSVTVIFKNCECDVFIPNSFTPNDDDKNDYFAPTFQCEYSYFYIVIMDRWGNTVYASSNINGKWDGKFKGNPCPDDVYVYKLEAIQKITDKKITRNGHISLFR